MSQLRCTYAHYDVATAAATDNSITGISGRERGRVDPVGMADERTTITDSLSMTMRWLAGCRMSLYNCETGHCVAIADGIRNNCN